MSPDANRQVGWNGFNSDQMRWFFGWICWNWMVVMHSLNSSSAPVCVAAFTQMQGQHFFLDIYEGKPTKAAAVQVLRSRAAWRSIMMKVIQTFCFFEGLWGEVGVRVLSKIVAQCNIYTPESTIYIYIYINFECCWLMLVLRPLLEIPDSKGY